MRIREELLERCTAAVGSALKEGFDEAAALALRTESVMVKVFENTLSVVQRWERLSLRLYLAKDKRIMFLEAGARSPEELPPELSRLAAAATKVKESFIYAPLPPPVNVKMLGGLADKRLIDMLEDPSPLAEKMVDAALSEGGERVAGMLEVSYVERALVTSSGAKLYEDSTALDAYLRVFSGDGTGQWSFGAPHLDERGVVEAARIAARYASLAKGPEPLEPGVYDVVLSPMVFGNLLNIVCRMASAFRAMIGMSMFAGKRPGDKVASELLTVYDDPRNRELVGARSFDDEGVPTMSKPVIERGVFRTFLHNVKTAARMGVRTTGNAGWLDPHAWSIRVRPGDRTLEELIGEVKRGVLITNNWYTRLQNYTEGVFSTISRDAAFLVEKGEIAKPLGKFRIADTLPNLLSNVAALGRELYDIWWWEVETPVRAPYVLAKSLHTSRHVV